MATQGQPRDESEGNQTVARKLPSTGNEFEQELEFFFHFSSTLRITKQRLEVVLVGAVSWQQLAC